MSQSRSSALAVRGPLIKTIVFVVSTLVVLALIGIELGGGNPLEKQREYSAVFTDTSGLKEGQTVRIGGVKVGSVDDVQVLDNTKGMVRFSVDDGHPLPSGVRLMIRYLNLTGDRFLELKQGSGPPLKTGSVIPMQQTAPALDLDVLLAGFKPLFDGLAPDQVNKLSSQLISVLQGQGGTVDSLLTHAATLTGTLADRDAVIGQVVNNLNQVLGTLDQRGPQVADTVDKLQKLTSGLAGDRQRLGNSIDNSNDLVHGVDNLLEATRGPLRDAVPQIDRLSQQVNQGRDGINQALDNLPGAYLRISRLGSRGSTYNLFICSLRVKTTGPNGAPIYTPWMGPPQNLQRCQPKTAPLETPQQRATKEGQ